jgi:PPM family protein phosphatase
VLRFSGAGVSDVGLVRPQNEDSGFVGPYVALVADGVGGAAAGEIASATAAYAAAAVALGSPHDRAERVLARAATAAWECVRLGVQRDHAHRLGMATTLTMLVTDGRRVVLGHVGDSRAYLLHDRTGDPTLTRLSTDHTYVQHLIDTGSLTEAGRASHPWRNVVLRAVDGDPDGAGIDLVVLDAAVGDRLLLCSDGLTDLVDDEAITSLLAKGDPAEASAALASAALAGGGHDNVTAIVLDLVDGPLVVGDGRLLGAVADPRNVVDPTAVRSSTARSA